MQNGKYVISIKRIKNYSGENLKPEDQYYQYAGYDIHSGSMSTGYPIFLDECKALRFKTVDDAKNWWKVNSKDMLNNQNCYDYNTLVIREVVYRTVDCL